MKFPGSIGLMCCCALALGCEQKVEAEPKPLAAQTPTTGEKEQETVKEATPSPSAKRAALAKPATLNAPLKKYVDSLVPKIDEVPAERKQSLDKLAKFVRSKVDAGKTAKLTFICTHNSRRSHMGQLWAAVAAAHYGIGNVETYSGGTEATAFNPRAVAAMKRAGFAIESPGGDNPHYQVTFAKDAPKQECFSKKFDDAANPSEEFAAVMTCTQADKSCPVVKGAALRVAVPYEDPKVADDTPGEAAKYDERAQQIATEMLYLFSRARG